MHFFVLGVSGTWLFAAVDACRTAQLMRAGLTPDAEDDVIARRFTEIPCVGHDADHHRHAVSVAHVAASDAADQELLPVALVRLALTCCSITFGVAGRRIASCGSIRGGRRRQLSRRRGQLRRHFRTGETTQFAGGTRTPLPFERRSQNNGSFSIRGKVIMCCAAF
jgi:hypothetical protein